MNSVGGWGDDVYQPDGSEQREDTGLLDGEDTLEYDGVDDPSTAAGPRPNAPGRWNTPV